MQNVLLDLIELSRSEWSAVRFMLRQQRDGQFMQRHVDGLGFFDTQTIRQAICDLRFRPALGIAAVPVAALACESPFIR